MKVLVTGGAGFIGSHLVDALVARGDRVIVVDNLVSGNKSNLNPAADFHCMSICDPELNKLFEQEKPRIVFHLAAQTSVSRSVADPVHDNHVNVSGSLNVITSCIRASVRKIVYASSSAAYGHPSYLPLDENHTMTPISPYGISKHTVEHYLAIYHALFGLSYTALRYANVYGPRQNPAGEGGVVAIFAQKMLTGCQPVIYRDGSNSRDYVYVGDVVAANLLAAAHEPCDVFNIGTCRETSDDTIFSMIYQACHYDGTRKYESGRPGDIKNMCLDSSRAKKQLNWVPQVKLEDGIEHTIQYYREFVARQSVNAAPQAIITPVS